MCALQALLAIIGGDIIMHLPGICGPHYKTTTWTVERLVQLGHRKKVRWQGTLTQCREAADRWA